MGFSSFMESSKFFNKVFVEVFSYELEFSVPHFFISFIWFISKTILTAELELTTEIDNWLVYQ